MPQLIEPQLEHLFAWDSETDLIGSKFGVCPPMICFSAAWHDANGRIEEYLMGDTKEEMADAEETLTSVLDADDVLIIAHNAAYDMAVAINKWPHLVTKVFDAYADMRVYCSKMAEKVLNLSDHGRLDQIYLPNGEGTERLKYHLDSLATKYLGRSRKAQKTEEDAWRLNYNLLYGVSAKDYPKEAADYAIADSVDALQVYEAQIERAASSHATLHGARMRAAIDFGYHLTSCYGIAVDQDYVDHLKERVEEIAHIDTLPNLVEGGFLLPAQEGKPHAGGHKDHVEGCDRKGCDCPVKISAPTKEKVAETKFKAHCLSVLIENNRRIRLTKTGKKAFKQHAFMPDEVEDWPLLNDPPAEGQEADPCDITTLAKYTSIDKEVMPILAALDPDVCGEYQRRQSVKKAKEEIALVDGHPVVHPQFDSFKETTRSSSYKSDIVPSRNIQQAAGFLGGERGPDGEWLIEPVEPRRVHVPREGRLFIDADYSALELCMVAQQTWDLFGSEVRCVHREKINKGYDLHAYLGSKLAARKSDEFGGIIRQIGASHEDEIYQLFKSLPAEGSDELKALYKHWRTFAKPVGLGFPGMLGPGTMVSFAAATYGIAMSEEDAALFREEWFSTYPEMVYAKAWCGEQTDPMNEVIGMTDDAFDDDERRAVEGYTYTTPFGITRRGARFCALANGKFMQSPAAEGFGIAQFNLWREMIDPSMDSPLYGCGIVAPVHDQVLVEVPYDVPAARKQAARVRQVLEESMSLVAPDVKIKAEPGLCMAYSKLFDPIYNEKGQLEVWSPPSYKEAA